MALHTLSTQTDNFTYQYLDAAIVRGIIELPHAQARAQALVQTCENDFAVLRQWFGNKTGFGPQNRITVRVQADSLAHNNGYHADGSTLITVDSCETAGTDQSVATDAVRALFVAEAIEVLMSYKNFKDKEVSWKPGSSDGEGLSRVAAATLHPVGYYSPFVNGPYVNTWLTGTRGNWVATTDNNDLTPDSYGCSILFIYYLRDQLNKPITDIIQRAGGTLEETYHSVTNQTVGFKPFRELLAKYLPFDPANPASPNNMTALKTDNPFPILEGKQRYVTLSFKEQEDPLAGGRLGVPAGNRGRVTVKPFFTCPAKSYGYTIYDRDRTLQCIATTIGFAQPKFTWEVNGQHASVGGSVVPTTTVLVDDPANPDAPKSITKAESIYWQAEKDVSSSQGSAGELDLKSHSASHDGHIQLKIQVDVSERFGTTETVSQTGYATLTTQELIYDAQFYADREACIDAFAKVVHKYVRVSDIPLIFTLPDPSPEIRVAMQALRAVIEELGVINERNPQLGRELTQALVERLQLPEQMLLMGAAPTQTTGAQAGTSQRAAPRRATQRAAKRKRTRP